MHIHIYAVVKRIDEKQTSMFQDSFWDRIHVYSDRAVLKLGTYDGSPPCEFQGFLNISMGAARFEENVGETAEEFLKETMRKP